ncbi:MAG: queuosine precursor transporter [Beijerinckiaceae bacterium]|nr:queuosine precursor transporter [Beijerinckiaceae bacterium]
MTSEMKTLFIPTLAMIVIVVAANILVQHPIHFLGLADHLTWGGLTYPVSFLVTDLTNRHFGPDRARKVVIAGFIIGVVLSFVLATPRIAIASGTAFLIGQLLDIGVFNRLRRLEWWRAPLIGSVVGSAIDTALFFSIAFYGIEPMSVPVKFFGVVTMPLWVSLGATDFLVKVAIAFVALLPYGALMKVVTPVEDTRTQPSA